MLAPYLLTCPLRSPDLAGTFCCLSNSGLFAMFASRPDRGAGKRAPAHSPLLPFDSTEHQLYSAMSPISFA
jgi:hypothetical protein